MQAICYRASTESHPSRSAGCSVRIKVRWTALTSRATSTSSYSASIDARHEAVECCSTESWRWQLAMSRRDTTSCSSLVARVPEPGFRHASGGSHPALIAPQQPHRRVECRFHAQSRRDLALENVAFRHRLMVLGRQPGSVRLKDRDRLFWIWLRRLWPGWQRALVLVQPATVVKWHRNGFRAYWRRKSQPRRGRPRIDPQVRKLIRAMWRANPTWG